MKRVLDRGREFAGKLAGPADRQGDPTARRPRKLAYIIVLPSFERTVCRSD